MREGKRKQIMNEGVKNDRRAANRRETERTAS